MGERWTFVVFVLCIVGAFGIGWWEGREAEREKALRAGVAYRTKQGGAWVFCYVRGER